jgi:alkylation response protein AidB-like acyl-CoA dehydrogenase
MLDRLFSEHLLQSLAPEEQDVVGHVRRLCADTIGPNAAAVAREDRFAWDTFRLLSREGVVATAFPKAFGGTDARQVLRIRIIEELGRVCSTAASMITGTDLSARAIIAGASQALQQQLLPGLCRGEIQAAFGLTEAQAGSDVRGLTSVARRDGDGYRLDGGKKFITRAGTADWLMVMARLDAQKGFVALLVPRDATGLTISPEVGKLGWFGVPIASLVFKDV